MSSITSNPNRMVTLLTPLVFAPIAGSISVLAARYMPGVDIDKGSVEAIFIAGATIAFAKAGLWLKGWQAYEQRTVSAGPDVAQPLSGDAGGEIDLGGEDDDLLGDDDEPGFDAEDDDGIEDDPVSSAEPLEPTPTPTATATAPRAVAAAVRARGGRVEGRAANGHPAAPGGATARAARTFRLTAPHMTGADVKAFQKALNVRFEAWGIHLHVDEDGDYGPATRHAAHQVAMGLGLASAEYEHGITPAVRGLIRTPSRRTPDQLERAKGRRGWLGKLRKRTAAAGPIGIGSSSARYPLSRRATLIGTPHAGTHTLGNWQSDNAVDLGVPNGTKMIALDDGVVVKVRHHPMNVGRFAGDQITIRGDHGNSFFYAHGKSSVQPGQRVQRGQSLGTTGSANGVPHLHFGVQHGDPRDIIGQGH